MIRAYVSSPTLFKCSAKDAWSSNLYNAQVERYRVGWTGIRKFRSHNLQTSTDYCIDKFTESVVWIEYNPYLIPFAELNVLIGADQRLVIAKMVRNEANLVRAIA